MGSDSKRGLNEAEKATVCCDVESGRNKRQPFSQRYKDFISEPIKYLQHVDQVDVGRATSCVDTAAECIQAKIKVSAHTI